MTLFIIIVGGLVVSIGIVALTSRSLNRFRAGRWWWNLFAVLLVAGLSVGVALSHYEYQPSPTIRVFGIPFPIVIFQLEDDRWIDYVHPLGVHLAIIGLNASVVASVALLPLLGIALWRARKHGRVVPHNPSDPSSL